MSKKIMEEAAKMVEQVNHEIAVKLFKARTRSGIYRSELADFLEIDEVELARYENGIESIPASTLALAASFMGISLNYFYEENATDSNSTNRIEEKAEETALV